MKTVIIAILFTATAMFANAQSRNDLKGPAAKNHKPWKSKAKTEQTIVMKSTDSEKVQGPAAKNNKVRSQEEVVEFREVAIVSEKSSLKGPAAKNTKVWSTNNNNDTSTLAKKDTDKKTK